jgi:elongation factor 1 alpha-like protein
VNQILVVLNKMDLVGWENETAYRAMESQLIAFLVKTVGYPAHRVRCVPVSGLTGTNLFPNKTDEDTQTLRSWYNGPTLLEALDSFEPPVQQQQKLLEKPLRIIISDVGESSGSGVSVRAKVVQGFAKQGESLVVLPAGDETTLTKLSSLHNSTANPAQQLSSSGEQQQRRRQDYCVAGELIDCTVTGVESQRVSTGSILARQNNTPKLASRCCAKIFVFELSVPLIRGAQVIFHMHHLDIPCNLAVLTRTLKADGTTTLKERPRALTKSCNAIVELQLAVPICMEAFSECRALGKFVLRRSGDSIAVGRIERVLQ